MTAEAANTVSDTPTAVPLCAYWSKQRAAAYLDVPTWTIDYLVRTDRLPYYLIAGKRRFTKADLDAYAATCRVAGAVAVE
jgi:excisionase family DNA binding protein